MKKTPVVIEKKWQRIWEKEKLHEAKDSAKSKKNFMLLVEFPYPSGNLHIGHWYAFSIPDILGRYLKMKGNNVMYPMGFDAFGLPAENAAIKNKINPRTWTEKNIAFMTGQLKSMGTRFDWARRVSTIDPDYYKWTQWIFLKMLDKNLAYRAKTLVNWCPKDKTVLANEQVIDGKCERCDSVVEQKEIEQWMFKITQYADRLIDDIEGLNWPQTTKLAQQNWIGRSEGALVKFRIKNTNNEIEVFTTRVDTIFGCTYIVIAPEHKLISELGGRISNQKEVLDYVKKSKQKTELQRTELAKDKTGVELKEIKAVNPFNNEEVPVFLADYVLGSYGTGAVMAVPAHDERDFEFAKKYELPIKEVIISPAIKFSPAGKENSKSGSNDYLNIEVCCYTEDGKLINSGDYNDLASAQAREKMSAWLQKNNLGQKTKNYRLHDWVLSRQRYWGVPIPVIHCPKCGFLPVPEKDLPVKLPPLKDFLPTGEGKSPLAKAKNWVNVKCPKCKTAAQRETDTMDTFVDSSWYFFRYADPKNKKCFADLKKIKMWLPVPMYVGGAEHNTMHLLYSRFFAKVLYDLKLTGINEPFTGRRNRGFILGPDGQKMSKSRGNVIDPDKEVAKFGADAVRMYLAFMGPYEQGGVWQTTGIIGIKRFLDRVQKLFAGKTTSVARNKNGNLDLLFNQTIKKIGEDISAMRFNTAISSLMILLNEMEKNPAAIKDSDKKVFLRLLAPFAPHLTEEIWRAVLKNKKSIHLEKWPRYDEAKMIQKIVDLVIQVNGKFRDKISVASGLSETDARTAALNLPKVKQFTEGKKISKTIYVKDKLINIVTQ